ncbi:MAG: response regulator transcription factor [FCB group bacterium]|nr:response regulator transcription factor [FCB group bacterium]
MTSDFTLISYLNDLNLSTRLVKISQQNDYHLHFPARDEILEKIPSDDRGLVIIDVDDPDFYAPSVLREIRLKTPFPIIGVIDQIQGSWRRQAARSELDLIIPKSLLEQNLAVVIRQICNGT